MGMMVLFPRYDPGGLGKYHEVDFASAPGDSSPLMWVDELGDTVLPAPFQCAKVVGGGVDVGAHIAWKPIVKSDFEQIIEESSRLYDLYGDARRPFSLGAIFAPPKSVSMAAMAGPRVERGIIEAHRVAVGFAARVIERLLVTRKQGKNLPVRAQVLRFTHPFSRANDPQLHDHLEWIPNPRDGALHTYQWFFFQYAVRQIYHFCLASELARMGFAMDIADPEELRWELSGVGDDELMLFSKRSEEVEMIARAGCQESLPAALRWASLSSSKALPKSPRLSLGEARADWEAECPQNRCEAVKQVAKKMPFVLPEVKKLFRKSATANLLTLQGRALALCLGQVSEPAKAMRQVDDYLLKLALSGKLVVTEIRSSRAYIHPERYQKERELFKIIGAGIGRGEIIAVRVTNDQLSPELKRALKARNRIRIVEGGLPANFSFAAPGRPSELINLKQGDASVFLDRLVGKEGGNVLIACDEAFRMGDFISVVRAISLFGGLDAPDPRQRFFTLRKGKGRSRTVTKVEVRDGEIPKDPDAPWMELENRPEQGAICIVPPDYPEVNRRAMNMEMARRLILSKPTEEASDIICFDLVVPLKEAEPGMEVVVFKNHPKFYLGTRWKIREVLADGSLELAKQRTKMTLSAEKLARLEPYLAVAESRPIRVVPGMLLQAERAFSQRKPLKISLRKGELVTAVRVDEQGGLVLNDGRVIHSRFRAFSPAFLLRTLPQGRDRPRVVLASAPAQSTKCDVRIWALQFRAETMIVFADDAARVAAEFGCENTLQKEQSRVQRAVRFVSGEGEFVPNPDKCKKLLRLHECLPASIEVSENLEMRRRPATKRKVEPEEGPKVRVLQNVENPPSAVEAHFSKKKPVDPKKTRKPPKEVEGKNPTL